MFKVTTKIKDGTRRYQVNKMFGGKMFHMIDTTDENEAICVRDLCNSYLADGLLIYEIKNAMMERREKLKRDNERVLSVTRCSQSGNPYFRIRKTIDGRHYVLFHSPSKEKCESVLKQINKLINQGFCVSEIYELYRGAK